MHVEHLKRLDKNDQLILCGPFKDHKGEVVIIKTESIKEAKIIAESDPFANGGFSTYELRTLEIADKENYYLLNK
ncbi:YciI family protein [Candidatus Neomarinimicrobiota bacterium]